MLSARCLLDCAPSCSLYLAEKRESIEFFMMADSRAQQRRCEGGESNYFEVISKIAQVNRSSFPLSSSFHSLATLDPRTKRISPEPSRRTSTLGLFLPLESRQTIDLITLLSRPQCLIQYRGRLDECHEIVMQHVSLLSTIPGQGKESPPRSSLASFSRPPSLY